MFKREISLIVTIAFLFSIILCRVGFIVSTNKYSAANSYNSYSITLDALPPYLYYSNGGLITNNIDSYLAVIKPNYKCIGELNKFFSYSEQKAVIEELKKGYPIIKSVDKLYDTKYIKIYKSKSTQNTVGQFVNASSSGLLSYVNTPVCSREYTFGVDAMGRALQGDDGEVISHNYDTKEGYILSVDSRVQDITSFACEELKSGCAVVMDIKTGNILSSVTKPDDSYINKATQQYSVGSVFKLIVTACALENNVDLTYNCVGSIVVGDTIFSCQKEKKHGTQNLKEALANSCNCYFVKLISTLGRDKIYKTMNDFGFNDSSKLYENWTFTNAVMPKYDDLKSSGQLALLGFGQGKLTSTPLQICSSLCTIANTSLTKPNFVIGTVNYKGIKSYNRPTNSKEIISKSTSKELINNMRYVVSNGTGYYANDSNNKSAGKTATAETGQYIGDRQLYNTWFAGIYPYDDPKYAIVIMCEDGNSGSEDCCPIFRTIVENLNKV